EFEIIEAREEEESGRLTGQLLVAGGTEQTRRVMEGYGRQLGLRTRALGSGEEAIEHILEDLSLTEGECVVLFDEVEDGLSGAEFARLLRSAVPGRSVSCLLAHGARRENTPRLWARSGIDAWIPKPLGRHRLATGIRQARLSAETAAPEQPRPAVQFDPRRPPQYRVLLVDDNIVNLKVATLILRQLDCEVTVARNGREAVDAAREADFDFVLMDCQMPILSGFDAAKEIRMLANPERRAVPIIALTANATTEDRRHCLACGMNDYLSKPVQKDALSRVITTWTHTNRDAMTEHDQHTTSEDEGLVLDMETIQSLRDLSGDDEPSLFEELVQIFLEDTPIRMADLEKAFEGADPDSLSGAAHALKSSAANLGALRLAEMFKKLEAAGREKQLESVESLIQNVRSEYQRVQEALEEEIR
ncbi:MAG TPA: response regulator, partial [Planctomycetes bacterium]|nr:response regulator [Planctomycetota bacterium]